MSPAPTSPPPESSRDTAGDHRRQRLADGRACLAAALDYLPLGLSALAVCPPDHAGVGKTHGDRCKQPGKAPWGEWKEYQDRLPTADEVRQKWKDNPTLNVGCALGPVSGVVRIDVEGEAAEGQLQEVSGGDLPPTWEFKSGRADGSGRGLLYAIPPGVVFRTTPETFQDGELRFQAKGAQTVLPPSRHKDGNLYQWLPGRGPRDIPATPAPAWMVARWGDPGKPHRRGRGTPPNGERLRDGHRNTCLTSMAGSMRRKGFGENAMAAALLAENAERCDPPLPETEVRGIAESMMRYDPADPALSRAGLGGWAGDQPEPAVIQSNLRQLRDVTADAMEAILAKNDPPTMFQRGSSLVRLRSDESSGAVEIENLTEAALRGVLARVADWVEAKVTKAGVVYDANAPPLEVVKDLASLPAWKGLPVLTAVVECPVFDRNGNLVDQPGYHPASRLWLNLDPALVVPEVPRNPAPAQVKEARELLVTELLGDFPFDDQASRAHAVAMTLQPFARQMIPGPTPIYLLDAPTEGTGKTLLADASCTVSTGRGADIKPPPTDEAEWRKMLTATLIEGPTYIVLDNIHQTLNSGTLAAVLTSRVCKDRILGTSEIVRVPNTATWIGTGNNITISKEILRRSAGCRMDSGLENPSERKNFRHPELLVWVSANRGRLVWAALTLIQAWIAAGKPPGKETLGMFESWTKVMGGILSVAGITGLLTNAKKFRTAHADQSTEWQEFITAWWDKYNSEAIGVNELYKLATDQWLLNAVLGDMGERSQRIRLGKAMTKVVGRVFGGLRVEAVGTDHHNCQQFQLTRLPPPPPTRPPPDHERQPGEDGKEAG
jgi:hypothetical protein